MHLSTLKLPISVRSPGTLDLQGVPNASDKYRPPSDLDSYPSFPDFDS
jgi:hypothetical protein